ncbi:MAG: hypothetical protein AAF919_14085 [Pseudomonadota bacterium]
MNRVLPVLLIALSFAVGPLIAVAAAPQGDDPVRLVLLPPWMDRDEMLRQSGAWQVGPFAAPFAVLATTDQASRPMAIDQRLRTAGAWTVLDGSFLAALCGVT